MNNTKNIAISKTFTAPKIQDFSGINTKDWANTLKCMGACYVETEVSPHGYDFHASANISGAWYEVSFDGGVYAIKRNGSLIEGTTPAMLEQAAQEYLVKYPNHWAASGKPEWPELLEEYFMQLFSPENLAALSIEQEYDSLPGSESIPESFRRAVRPRSTAQWALYPYFSQYDPLCKVLTLWIESRTYQ